MLRRAAERQGTRIGRRLGRRPSKPSLVVPARRSARDWPARFSGRIAYSDLVVIVAVLLAFRFLVLPDTQRDVTWPSGPQVPYDVALGLIGIVWLVALSVFETRDRNIVGAGEQEYRRLVNATIAVFAIFVSVAFFLRIEVSRGLFLVAMPVGLVALIFSRWLWRIWLRRQQRRSKYVYRALVLGEPAKAAMIIRAIRRADTSGFDIVGVVTNARGRQSIGDVPVVGGFAHAMQAMDATDADTIIVAEADEVHPEMMRQLGWDVADRNGNLVVAPALTDVAGPRIHSRPAAGLPLVHVEFPRLEGVRRFAKRTFDLFGSVALIVVFSPVMLVTAVAIRMETPGRVLYRQSRIGLGGDEFGMLKFRSMVADADDQLASLLDMQGTNDSPLFKVADDPRITKVGRVIRKHSLDELPQLFNVLVGTMSLVGPRPQRAAEVALYDDAAHRRLRVKPGMSGLWQVSGRSTLSWEDALRLDLYYVENWSFMQDLQILVRTLTAVIVPGRTAH
ncbi:sugar transferase [Microbacterium sp. 77mftsu3.1]|uniref:sugar transferase n=1 Tax=Microbacterium sp. 77mftsu3.1 TaxID=1761802 RepID=UPI00088A0FBF|nr:sugar transferase [Microbacterium sp. 77mftsu3.1]SDG69868.1 Undecaprenyl-phosphate galactose phosphotransferase, WbaP/exopolysaccharide biosynthesis polyprenyl glycosylphosphotransferase [Microbacterium sp. 77mftsu3.1]